MLVKKYRETLTNEALTWYFHLSENSISLFVEPTNVLIKVHSGTQKVEKRMKEILKSNKKAQNCSRNFINYF